MSKCCSHPECQHNFPGCNWGHQRCLFADMPQGAVVTARIATLVSFWQGSEQSRVQSDKSASYWRQEAGKAIEEVKRLKALPPPEPKHIPIPIPNIGITDHFFGYTEEDGYSPW